MKKVAVDCRMPQGMREKLYELGIESEEVRFDSSLDFAVSSHPDMNLLIIGNKRFTSQKTFVRVGNDVMIKRADGVLKYPIDAELNAVCVGNDFICREKSVFIGALEYAHSLGMNIINVNQGYVKCNLLIVDTESKAVITEDVGMSRVLSDNGYDVLLLNEHDVRLEPYSYGFIGGASGTLEDTVFFCGDVRMHTEFEKISAFCKKYNKDIISLGNEPLYDYGSILPLN